MNSITFLFPEFLKTIQDFDRVEIYGRETAGDENSPAVFFREIICSCLESSFEVEQELCDQINEFKFVFYRNQRRFHSFSSKIEHLEAYVLTKTRHEIFVQIFIPQKIIQSIEKLVSVEIQAILNGAILEQKQIHADELKIEFCRFKKTIYKKCDSVQYKVTYNNKTVEIIKFNNKADALYKAGVKTGAHVCVRHKVSALFEDSDEGRNQCLLEIDKKIEDACQYSNTPIGTKNLIYYTVYFDNGYTDLLELSVNSILKHSEVDFDLMIITDESTQQAINKLSFIKKIRPDFLITPTPIDGVAASQNKTLIYEWDKIDEYKNIMFLDCDIMCIKDINKLFKSNYIPGSIYAAKPLTLDYGAHIGVWHGFALLGQPFVDEMRAAKQMPFNAGQFVFVNTARMRQHFENVNWMMQNWSGEYFFEQAFMCCYFGKAYSIGGDLMDRYVTLINTTVDMKYIFDHDTHLIHFIAPPLQADKKIEFINKFFHEQIGWHASLKRSSKKTWIYALFKKIQSIFHSHSKNSRHNY